jgi:hypothetical protein
MFFVYYFVEYETNGCLDITTEEDVDADSWEQVGPKKKSVLTRKVTEQIHILQFHSIIILLPNFEEVICNSYDQLLLK